MTKDPVCGMQINEEQASSEGLCTQYEDRQYCFCSERCAQQFQENPERFSRQA